ncbi:hypothetical protein S83_055687, partial [Arachis hypogaea]
LELRMANQNPAEAESKSGSDASSRIEEGQSAISVEDTLKIIICRKQHKKLYSLEMELAAARNEGFVLKQLLETNGIYSEGKPLVMIGVLTTFGRQKNRDAIRNVWMGSGAALKKLEDGRALLHDLLLGEVKIVETIRIRTLIVTVMKLKVDLECHKYYKKVKKLLAKFPQIRDEKFDEKQNIVTIMVMCCSHPLYVFIYLLAANPSSWEPYELDPTFFLEVIVCEPMLRFHLYNILNIIT